MIFQTLATTALAFDSKKCREEVTRLNWEFLSILTPFVVSGQSTTSTGECALIGHKEKRQNYLAVNLNEIKGDAAKGSGESIEVLATLYGCNTPESKSKFNRVCKSDLNTIFDGSDIASLDSLLVLRTVEICRLHNVYSKVQE